MPRAPRTDTFAQAYDYRFPDDLIAQAPATPRDSSRLMVFDRKSRRVTHTTFANLADHLPKNAVLVFNETKVIPARLWVKRKTGGKVELLYLANRGGKIHALANRRLEVGEELKLSTNHTFTVTAQAAKGYWFRPSFQIAQLQGLLQQYGETPIPPYIKHTPLTERELKAKYQTVFARNSGSVAAPTASLHFTKALLKKIERSGCQIAFVTLHVNIGTFAPLTPEQLKSGRLHEEYYTIDHKTASLLNSAKRQGRPIVAVGTTVVRTLESAADASGKLKRLTGSTDLFIRPGYPFRFVTDLITNFHVPRSSLLMLVAALVGRTKLLSLYRIAVRKRYRFFSFGDGMLITSAMR